MNHRWLFGLVLLFSVSMAACQPVQAEPAVQNRAATSTLSTDEEANKAVVQSLYDEAFNNKDLSYFGVAFAADAVFHELDFGADGLDPALLLSAFPDLQVTVDQWIVEGDKIVTAITFTGTHQGEFMEIAPTGKPMTISMVDIFRFQEGKIVELWHYIPVADILEQISDESEQ